MILIQMFAVVVEGAGTLPGSVEGDGARLVGPWADNIGDAVFLLSARGEQHG